MDSHAPRSPFELFLSSRARRTRGNPPLLLIPAAPVASSLPTDLSLLNADLIRWIDRLSIPVAYYIYLVAPARSTSPAESIGCLLSPPSLPFCPAVRPRPSFYFGRSEAKIFPPVLISQEPSMTAPYCRRYCCRQREGGRGIEVAVAVAGEKDVTLLECKFCITPPRPPRRLYSVSACHRCSCCGRSLKRDLRGHLRMHLLSEKLQFLLGFEKVLPVINPARRAHAPVVGLPRTFLRTHPALNEAADSVFLTADDSIAFGLDWKGVRSIASPEGG